MLGGMVSAWVRTLLVIPAVDARVKGGGLPGRDGVQAMPAMRMPRLLGPRRDAPAR
mgnify:CR=1 FL=1